MGERFDLSVEERDYIIARRKEKEVKQDVREHDKQHDKGQSTKNTTTTRETQDNNNNGNGQGKERSSDVDKSRRESLESLDLVYNKKLEPQKGEKEVKDNDVECAGCGTQFKIENEAIPEKCPKCGTTWL